MCQARMSRGFSQRPQAVPSWCSTEPGGGLGGIRNRVGYQGVISDQERHLRLGTNRPHRVGIVGAVPLAQRCTALRVHGSRQEGGTTLLPRGGVLADDALRDLDDCPLVLEGGLAEERLGLFGRARLVDHEESAGEVDVGVALGLADHAVGGDELRRSD